MADKFQLKALITGVDKLSPTLAGIRKNVAGFRKQLQGSGLGNIGLSDILAGGALAAPFVAGAKAAIDFESAMADVKKVVNFDAPAQFKQMSDDVLSLSEQLPMAADGIAAIVAAGGQAGIPREQLKGFAQDAVKMGVAFDQTAEESGQMMAKWRTGLRLSQQGVVELADKINYLGNNGPATSKQISSIVTAIGPLGEVAGLASGQIAAIGATLAGVGVQEDVAATGMKNFMLTLTAGKSATQQQQQAFKALRLDSAAVAKAMQKDAQGTITKVLTAISKVDKSKQAAVLSTLFGRESIGAIAPMLTNLDLLRKNLQNVGDASKYTGSMDQEYASRAATTANNLQLLQNRVTKLGISVGSILLPPLNDALGVMGPIISQVASLASANPGVIKGVLGAAAGFAALRVGVMVATTAMKIFSTVTSMSPIGLIVRVIALAAGLLIANWSTVGPWFAKLWERIKSVALAGWEIFKTVASFTPLGLIISNWEPIVAWFKGMYERIRPYIEPLLNAGKWVAGKVGGLFEAGTPERTAASTRPQLQGLASRAASGSLVAQSQAANQQQLNGALVVRFENAPPGLRPMPAQTNQPGLKVTSNVGYRSLAGGPR